MPDEIRGNVVRTERGLAILVGAVMPPPGSHRHCPFCQCEVSAEKHGPFRDVLSFREFQQSGLCQVCQDSVFEGGDDEPY